MACRIPPSASSILRTFQPLVYDPLLPMLYISHAGRSGRRPELITGWWRGRTTRWSPPHCMTCQHLRLFGVHPAGNHQVNIRDSEPMKVELPSLGVFGNASCSSIPLHELLEGGAVHKEM